MPQVAPVDSPLSLGSTVALPPPPSGWHDYVHAVLRDGTLALLRADRDIHAEHQAWWDQVAGGNWTPRPDLWSGRARLSVFDGMSEHSVVDIPMAIFPIVDRLASGDWLVVSARTISGPVNAHVYSPAGAALRSFAVGDGVEHVRCATDGNIWMGYFDEGVFLDNSEDGAQLAGAGVVQFTSDGSVKWRYRNGTPDPFIADCYAMTLSQDALWVCPYTDFPIMRIEDGHVRMWANDVAGAGAFAVSADHLLFAGGYEEQRGRIALVKLEERAAVLVGESTIDPAPPNGFLQGQGDVLHIVAAGSWTRLGVDAVRQAFTA